MLRYCHCVCVFFYLQRPDKCCSFEGLRAYNILFHVHKLFLLILQEIPTGQTFRDLDFSAVDLTECLPFTNEHRDYATTGDLVACLSWEFRMINFGLRTEEYFVTSETRLRYNVQVHNFFFYLKKYILVAVQK
jgi:hypothetical protein